MWVKRRLRQDLLAALFALRAPEPFLPFFSPPEDLAALFTAPLTYFPGLPTPPNLSFAETGVLLPVFSLFHCAPKLVGERGMEPPGYLIRRSIWRNNPLPMPPLRRP